MLLSGYRVVVLAVFCAATCALEVQDETGAVSGGGAASGGGDTPAPTAAPTLAPAWNAGSGCTAASLTATQMDACTCKWACRDLDSWTETAHLPTTHAQSTTTSSSESGETSGTTHWNEHLASLVSNSSTKWVANVCNHVCAITAAGTKVKRYGVEEENFANSQVANSAFKWVQVSPATTVSDTDTTNIKLPATAYAIAKATILTTEKELTGSYGYGGKFDVFMQQFKVLQCVTTVKSWEKCCKIPTGKTTANFQVYKNAVRYFAQNPTKGTHAGGSCTSADGCWDYARPPVSCNVKKSTTVFKICMKSQKKENDDGTAGAWQDVSPQQCWYPTTNPNKIPKPFCLGDATTAEDCASDAADFRGLHTTGTFSDIFNSCCYRATRSSTGCGADGGSVDTDMPCRWSNWASQLTWAEEDGITF